MRTKAIIIIFFVAVAVIAFVYTIVKRTVKKKGILNFLKETGISFDQLLVAHESGHNVAINNAAKKLYLIKYAPKKKKFQHREFSFDQFERLDFYLDGLRVYSLSKDSTENDTIELKKNELNRNVVSLRMFIKGIELPYIMTLDQFAEGHGSNLSDSNLIKNVDQWQFAFYQIARN